MKLEHQVGQLLIMGFDGTAVSAHLRTALATLQPGGVILFARNVESPRQTWELLRDCQAGVTAPLFRCVDMEGGTVDRLKNILAPAPSVEAVAATSDKKVFRRHGRLIGDECRALGFNVDFAPVFDLAFAASRSVLTSRTVSDDPKATIAYAREFLRGLADARVLGCGKHFPGLGEANLDTHKDLPAIDKSWRALWNEDLLPYRALRNAIAFVMVAHAAYPQVTHDRTPASLSHQWITDILRKKIGYKGLVISDDLEMGGALAAGSIEHAAVESIRAGADIFLVCHNEAHVWGTYRAVLREAERDAKFAALVARAAERVARFKKRAKLSAQLPAAPTDGDVARLRESLAQFSADIGLPTAAGAP